MNFRISIVVALAVIVASCSRVDVPQQQPYQLPAEVQESLMTLAKECDVLVLGETHGTKEVPAIVEGLLPALSKLGYRALALEIPHDQQPALAGWATGATDVLPTFFTAPPQDGRNNEQVLALVRSALRPPFDWELICFDETEQEMLEDLKSHLPKEAHKTPAELAATLSFEDTLALGLQRDAKMAKRFVVDLEKLPKQAKVLVICGNVHARTSDHAPAESPLKHLWPSFAALVARDPPALQLRSINVQAFSGDFFNGGKLMIFDERPLAKIEARPTPNADWAWELNLPHATAATFLAAPR